ncbi:Histidine phosphatase superfamily (branch 1) [Polaribacter sp. KT25b]|uniref:SixA phosphatase family protein n=1 Tax=Polaribacter sp. KT25b TaxID=1855336 RepID=UPI000879BBD0|nr:phosphoglycerate mutase family protein [Polaribacter sp. KT25b]SDS03799.1 Histidine phosphatase superfamily (branch 1) [Polaribacter sp. KT25b]
MKKYLLVLFVVLISCNSNSKKEETDTATTTYFLIRHAEKDRTDASNKDPNLNPEGLERAEKWAKYFQNIDLDAVYSTNYNRTQQTAKPTADSKKLAIINYNPSNMYDSIFQKNTSGKTTLVVGHSNTTPAFVNKILDQKKYKDIDDNDNSSLFIITINKNGKTSKIEKVN